MVRPNVVNLNKVQYSPWVEWLGIGVMGTPPWWLLWSQLEMDEAVEEWEAEGEKV